MNDIEYSNNKYDFIIEATVARFRANGVEPTMSELLAAVRQAAPEINRYHIAEAVSDYCLRREPGIAAKPGAQSAEIAPVVYVVVGVIFVLVLLFTPGYQIVRQVMLAIIAVVLGVVFTIINWGMRGRRFF